MIITTDQTNAQGGSQSAVQDGDSTMPEMPEITDSDIMKAAQFLTGYLAAHTDDPQHSGLLWSITVLKIAAAHWLILSDQVGEMIAAGQPTCCAPQEAN